MKFASQKVRKLLKEYNPSEKNLVEEPIQENKSQKINKVIFDTSALLALVNNETGEEKVEPLDGSS